MNPQRRSPRQGFRLRFGASSWTIVLAITVLDASARPGRAGAGALAPAPAPAELIREAYVETARAFVERMNRDDQAALQAMFTPGLRTNLDRLQMGDLCRKRLTERGKIVRLGAPTIAGALVHFPMAAERGDWELRLGLHPDGLINSLYIADPSTSDPKAPAKPDANAKVNASPTAFTPNQIRINAEKIGKRLIDLMNADDQDAIQSLFTPGMRDAMPKSKMTQWSREKIRLRGKFVSLSDPVVLGYAAEFNASAERGDWTFKILLTRSGAVDGIFLFDPAPGLPVPERNATPLDLPFRGEWTVEWGGDAPEQNYHIPLGNRHERRAIDFTVRDASGKNHKSDGQTNDDYYAYGRAILAPADGEVVMAIDGVPDNRPGFVSVAGGGNAVTIRHGAREFSGVYHLKPGSLTVKVGDRVKAGQVVGRCGNSGNSGGPHLHYQLTNAPLPPDATGYAPIFENVRLTRAGNSTVEKECTLVKNDRIESAAPP